MTMHRIWQIPRLLIHIVAFLPAFDISCTFHIPHHFKPLLKANLRWQIRPLPDAPRSRTSPRKIILPEDVAAQASSSLAQKRAIPLQLNMENSYYFWRGAARGQIFGALLPCLQSLFTKYGARLMSGYEALAERMMDFCLQTNMPYHDLYKLVHGEAKEGWGGPLGVEVKAVTVFCLGDVRWGLLYKGVRYWEHRGAMRFSISLEGEEGVRLKDVMEDLAGTLVIYGMSGGLGQDASLVWVFGHTCEEHEVSQESETSWFRLNG